MNGSTGNGGHGDVQRRKLSAAKDTLNPMAAVGGHFRIVDKRCIAGIGSGASLRRFVDILLQSKAPIVQRRRYMISDWGRKQDCSGSIPGDEIAGSTKKRPFAALEICRNRQIAGEGPEPAFVRTIGTGALVRIRGVRGGPVELWR